MPLIVDEIVISVEVTNAEAGGAAASPAAPAPQDRQALLAECVERVLELLRRREER